MLNKRDLLSKVLMFSVQTRSSITVFNLEVLRVIYLKTRSPGWAIPSFVSYRPICCGYAEEIE
jgi:hypothetical protein